MEWEVRIRGDDVDLRMLAESFTGPAVTITERGTEFFIGGTDLASCSDAQSAQDRARGILTLISGAARDRLGSVRPLEVDHVVQIDETKRHLTIIPDPCVVTLRGLPPTLAITQADGTVEKHRPADPVVEDLRKAAQSAAVEKVLRLRSAPELLWTDLYRIFEIIERDGGLSNVSKSERSRFTGTANHQGASGDLARHGALKGPAPKNTMPLPEAREFIARIVRDWLATK